MVTGERADTSGSPTTFASAAKCGRQSADSSLRSSAPSLRTLSDSCTSASASASARIAHRMHLSSVGSRASIADFGSRSVGAAAALSASASRSRSGGNPEDVPKGEATP